MSANQPPLDPTEPASDDRLRIALRAIALRIEAAKRLADPGGSAVLRSIVEATAGLFGAEAASIALYDAATDKLVFVVAAGDQGQGVVGLAIDSGQGVAGYVFATAQPIALADVAADARFGRSTAEQTGYVPRSLIAVPLIDDEGILGVLEVLDKRGDAGFDLRDVELAGVFARQATVAIRSSRVERDTASLIRTVLSAVAVPDGGSDPISESEIDAIVSDATAGLADGPDDPLWALADEVARLREADPGELDLVRELLAVLVRRAARRRGTARHGGTTPVTGAPAGDGPSAVLPAWAEAFARDHRPDLVREAPFPGIDRAWAFGVGDGAGVTVAVIDSGIEAAHPAIGGALTESVRVELDGDDARVIPDDPIDAVGHGTACAGIVHALAPKATLVSVRVLGSDNRGKGLAFAAGLDWAIAQGASVVNLSLSSRSEAMFATLHDLADRAYFANCLLVSAANNVAIASYPSLFAAVVSVAAHDVHDAETWFYNPHPPVEFGAHGLDVDVAWRDGSRIVATGNSFAAPHIAGLAARIRAAHPGVTPFETKTILAATANRP